MNVQELSIPGLKLISPKAFGDSRGWFLESWQSDRYRDFGMPHFVQDNLSRSSKGVLRGLHLQSPFSQAKLVTVFEGEVFDVAVDLRQGSPSFGKWHGELLSADNHRQFFIPEGFAHGFQVLSDSALFFYKCSDFYHPEAELTVQWNDPSIGIQWPGSDVVLSQKDQKGIELKHLPKERLLPFS